MNQTNFEVVKQEMESMNINILGICEPKWTRMGEFNSDDYYIYYYYLDIIFPQIDWDIIDI